MKFLYSDTQDYVDPSYDFINDRTGPERERYWTDAYAHELMNPAPYDGLLLSMSAIRQAQGVAASKVRYSTKEEQRLLRYGARRFLRFGGPQHKDLMLMGDCGAFAYATNPTPAYSPTEVFEFYSDAEFTHGVSPDHIVFDCDLNNPPPSSVSREVRDRVEITLTNAEEFLRLSHSEDGPFVPLGAVQGWSPSSMGEAAHALESMGYQYLAVGGLVPLRVDSIKKVLTAIRERIKPTTRLHLLGFAKAEQIHEFTSFGISSFDSTSPLIRAFKDQRANYYMDSPRSGLDYYTAIRVPQAIENTRLVRGIKRGIFSAEDLHRRESIALSTLRAYDQAQAKSLDALDAVMDYYQFLVRAGDQDAAQQEKALSLMRERVRRTIEDMPWKRCQCDICKAVGVEVIIFRSSNRNKRRGFHNLGVYHRHLKRTLESAS
jgi:hypothetical protein